MTDAAKDTYLEACAQADAEFVEHVRNLMAAYTLTTPQHVAPFSIRMQNALNARDAAYSAAWLADYD